MPLQNHIHLAVLPLGSAPELAPTLKWKVTDRLEIPKPLATARYTLTGKLKRHAVVSGGNLVQKVDFKYTIKVQADYTYTLDQRRDQLKAMNGALVKLCDVFHANDGADHTSDVKTMFCARVGEFAPIGPGLQYFLVQVELLDAS